MITHLAFYSGWPTASTALSIVRRTFDESQPAAKSRRRTMTDVTVVVGAGSIGQAIARRVGAGNHLLLADRRREKPTRRRGH